MTIERVRSGSGEVCVHGATVTEWDTPDGKPALFLSRNARFEPPVPIRGGVPIVFPWFGDDPKGLGRPAHGFARRLPWTVCRGGGEDPLVLELVDTDTTRALWDHRFRIEYRVSLGEVMTLEFDVENRGDTPFTFESALHTYFQVGDVERCSVHGLSGARYLDKTQGQKACVQEEDVLRFSAETDRTYLGTESACELRDEVMSRTLRIEKSGSRSTVVWNPWVDWARKTADFGDDEWRQMLCVESGNIGDDAVTLDPGGRHCMTVTVRLG